MRKTQLLKTVAYIKVRKNDGSVALVDTATLNPAQKLVVGTRLKQIYLNALFNGRATFEIVPGGLPEEDVFAELRK